MNATLEQCVEEKIQQLVKAEEQNHHVKNLKDRTEQALRESREHFQILAETIPQMVWISDSEGNLSYYNQRWYHYTGMTFEESKSVGWKAVLHPDDVQSYAERWSQAIKTGSWHDIECRLKRASDQTYRWHLVRAVPLRNEQGEIIKWVGTSTDIDDLKYQIQLTKIITDNTSCALFMIDAKGYPTFMNPAAERITDYTLEEIKSRPLHDAIHCKYPDGRSYSLGTCTK